MAFEIVEIDNQNNIQDIKIPEKFRINDDKFYMKQVGNALYIIPYHTAWDSLINSTSLFSDDFMQERGDLPEQERETFDQW